MDVMTDTLEGSSGLGRDWDVYVALLQAFTACL